MKFSSKDFFSKCDQIRSFLRIWSRLLKKSLMENFIFCAVKVFTECRKICENCAFPQNFDPRKLGKISEFYVVLSFAKYLQDICILYTLFLISLTLISNTRLELTKIKQNIQFFDSCFNPKLIFDILRNVQKQKCLFYETM